MRLGLITDIHEQVELLRITLDRFRQQQVDRIVVIGDIFETGERIEETCRLLAEAKAVGVWRNHDYGLCVDPPDDIRARFPASVAYMTSLHPRLELDGCYFAHVEPWLAPEDIMDLWFFEGPPASDGRLDRIFNAVPNRLLFAITRQSHCSQPVRPANLPRSSLSLVVRRAVIAAYMARLAFGPG